MSAQCEQTRLALGAYALDTLEPSERESIETHLAGCADCLSELAELESVVPALAALSREDIARPEPSAGLFDRIVTAVDASPFDESPATRGDRVAGSSARSTRSRRWLLAVAASIVLLAGVGTVVGISVSSRHTATTVASATSGGVTLRVAASDRGAGTRLELTASGLPAHEHCHLVATAADGSRHDAGSWDATYDGQAELSESTDVPRSQLRSLTLYGDNGKRLVVVTT